MKTEISAGGIIVRKIGTSWEVLLIKDMNNTWTFPKGLVEKGEDMEATAKREIMEEVGMTDLSLIAPLTAIHYMYNRNGLIRKNVQYFLFSSKGREELKGQKEEGISDVQWFPVDKAITIVGYVKTNRKLLEEAQRVLQKT